MSPEASKQVQFDGNCLTLERQGKAQVVWLSHVNIEGEQPPMPNSNNHSQTPSAQRLGMQFSEAALVSKINALVGVSSCKTRFRD
jgi:hypothetical protein